MKGWISIGTALALTWGCAYGPHSAASKLPDGRVVHYVDYTTHGEGTQIKTVDSFLCAKEDPEASVICNPFRHTSASGHSVTVSLFNGAGTALILAAGAVGAAHELRPSQYQEQTTQVGGGAESASQGGAAQSGSESLSSAAQQQSTSSAAAAYSKQRQGQAQGQQQGQEQTATGGSANAGASVAQPQDERKSHKRYRH